MKTMAGSGSELNNANAAYARLHMRTKDKSPVSWSMLFFTGVAAASAVAYYRIERERRLERAMGKVVSSESEGYSPNPNNYAKRKFVATKWGWMPRDDAFGAGE